METHENEAQITLEISKKYQTHESKKFILSNEKYENIFGEVFNSTCLPSGNLVDGLLLDLHTGAG